jgi:hypothetical protein
MYLVGAVYHIYKSYVSKGTKDPINLAIICSSIYVTTMAHWHNMKPSGIAKTVDMITVITNALFVSFKESHKWNPIYGGREIWNSVLLMGGVTYVVNTVILSVPVLLPIDDERLQLATTVAHTFWLHVMTNVVAIWCVWRESS